MQHKDFGGMTMDAVSASERLIVALDVDTKDEAAEIVKALGDAVSFYKVGYQLYIASGLEVVRELTRQGKKVFLDLKLDDTPRTVEKTIKNMEKDGIEFFTLQGNEDTAKAARAGRGERENPKFLQVFGVPTRQERNLQKFRSFPFASSSSRSLRCVLISLEREELYAVFLHILYGFFHCSRRVIQLKVKEHLFPLPSEFSNNLQSACDIQLIAHLIKAHGIA